MQLVFAECFSLGRGERCDIGGTQSGNLVRLQTGTWAVIMVRICRVFIAPICALVSWRNWSVPSPATISVLIAVISLVSIACNWYSRRPAIWLDVNALICLDVKATKSSVPSALRVVVLREVTALVVRPASCSVVSPVI